MPTRSLKTRALILCLTLFLAVIGIANVTGQDDSRLAEAQRLIQQKDYSQALLLLAAIQRSNPELRDQTNRLVAQIMAVNQRFNNTLELLNKAVQAGDQEKIQQYIGDLTNLYPSRAASLTSRAGTLVGFWKMMDRALALLNAGKPREALAVYLLALTDSEKAGVRLPRAEFEAAGYGEILTASVTRTVEGLLAAATREADAPPDQPALRASLGSLAAHPTADAAQQFDQLSQPLIAAAGVEGEVRRAAASLLDMSQALSGSSSRPDEYLGLLTELVLGRGDGRAEGIAYALRRLWADDARWVSDTTAKAFLSAFDTASQKFAAGSFAAADADLAALPPRAVLAAKAVGLASAQLDVGTSAAWKAPASGPDLRALLDRGLTIREYAAQAQAYRLLISYRSELAALPAVGSGGPSPGTATESVTMAAARAALDARWSEAQAQESGWNDRAQAWQSRGSVTASASTLAGSSRAMAARFHAFAQNDLEPRDLQYALRIASLASADFPQRLQSASIQRAAAEDLKDGTTNGQAPAAGSIARKRPDQALTVLTEVAGKLDSLVSDLSVQEQKLEAEKPWVKASPAFTALYEGTSGRPGFNALLQDARAERAAVDTLTAAAQKQMDSAALASREGDNNFSQAQAAIKRGDPDGASSSLELATAAYLRSLADAYSDHAFARTTTESDDLNARILKLQNDISVARAQKELGSINRLVAAGDYLAASDALDAAVRAWNQTQQSSYPPFDNLRLAIQTAVELSRGRQILRSDPKADVVNAFLKNARDALAAGRLNDAARNVKDALAVAPNFGTAKVLQLQIKKQTDPVGFQRDAAAQISTYIKMASDRGNRPAQTEAYNALIDYSSLDPRFADQTRTTIQELAYDLGFKARPPSAAQVAQSAALVRQAAQLAQQGTPDAFQGALELLKQADRLTPNNRAVIDLDGQIRTRMGSTALAALSPSDTQVYNQAFSLFLSGAYQDAYDRVLQIWNDPKAPRNKTYPQLQRLKKRLEVQLNIS